MSERALRAMAAFLLAVCVVAAVLLADRLGWVRPAAPVEWTFENAMLDVTRGQRVVLRPMLEGEPPMRYTFLAELLEPATDDPMAKVPHRRAGVEEWDGDGWGYRAPEAFALCQLGALGAEEWLKELGPVEEQGGQGGRRTLLRAVCGTRSGAVTAYLFDPKVKVPAFGWIRREMVGQSGGIPEIQYASDGGIVELPPR